MEHQEIIFERTTIDLLTVMGLIGGIAQVTSLILGSLSGVISEKLFATSLL